MRAGYAKFDFFYEIENDLKCRRQGVHNRKNL